MCGIFPGTSAVRIVFIGNELLATENSVYAICFFIQNITKKIMLGLGLKYNEYEYTEELNRQYCPDFDKGGCGCATCSKYRDIVR